MLGNELQLGAWCCSRGFGIFTWVTTYSRVWQLLLHVSLGCDICFWGRGMEGYGECLRSWAAKGPHKKLWWASMALTQVLGVC